MDILEAIRSRASVRAFLDKPVERAVVQAVLDAARWAPSGVNAQPWEVVAVTGETRKRLAGRMLAARKAGEPASPDYRYYPVEWKDPYKTRRKVCGMALYGALGIGRDDSARRVEAWNRNYGFFGAPVGLMFFLDRDLSQGSWVDMGMFLQSVMIAARSFGLGTCPQAAMAEYPGIAREVLGVPGSKALVCGMALGYPDPDAPVNRYRTEREPVSGFTTWRD